MRQLRRILRLHHEGASARQIVRAVGIARSTLQDALTRASKAGLSWPLSDEMTDVELEGRLFARFGAGAGKGTRKHPEPDWAELSRELRRPSVSMTILWEEYRKVWPDGYGYSRFCELLRAFQQRLSPVMRPHALIRQQVDARITSGTVELFHKGQRVAAHQRRYGGATRHGTQLDHMPSKHRHYAEWVTGTLPALGRADRP